MLGISLIFVFLVKPTKTYLSARTWGLPSPRPLAVNKVKKILAIVCACLAMAAQRLQGTLVQPSAPIYRDWGRLRWPRGRKKQRKWRTLLRACLASTAQRPRRKFVKPSIPSQGDWTKVAPPKNIQRSGFSWKHMLGTRKTRHTVRPVKVMSNNYHFHKNETSSHYSNNDRVKVIAAKNKKQIVCNCGLKPSWWP